MGNIFGWVFGQALDPIKDGLLQAQQQYFNAKNDTERLKAEDNVKYWEGRMNVAVAAAQHDKWWSFRSLTGFCVALYIFKIIVWDTVLKLDVTPYPGDQVTYIVMTVIGFYFVTKSAETIATIVGGRISGR